MLDEVSMDKKTTNRSVQPPIKGNGTELKKTQDVQSNTKQLPRGSRKWDQASNNGFKFDQNRKPAPQKSKAFDKRPRSRGVYNSCGKENTQINNDLMRGEVGSLFSSGSKKQNLNHLLNFHYEPRGDAVAASRQQHFKQNYGTKALMATQAHKYNKEQFLQANCQFVVHIHGDYTPYMVDPDLLVNWDLVELIRVWSNDNTTCPICLYPPVAGKITRCGHVFCWSCILHYLALTDKTWRKCPICYEAVHKNDLKSVECIEHTVWNVGQKITLQLMKREKGSLIASPVSQYENRASKQILGFSEKTLDTVHSKLLLATDGDVLEIIKKEEEELKEQMNECKGCAELCFVEEAADLLSQRKQKLELRANANKTSDSEISKIKIEPISIPYGNANNYNEGGLEYKEIQTPIAESPNYDHYGKLEQDNDSCENTPQSHPEKPVDYEPNERTRYESLSSDGDEATTVTAEDLFIGTNQNGNQPVKYFYFYQGVDGQQVYLHAINVRMLEMTYGSLEHCPLTITGAIVEKESGSMTLELRKRLRYMQHVPITCQFEVVEIALEPPLITPETFAHFQDQLALRKRKRAKRAREERKREKYIEECTLRMLGRTPTPHLRIESLYHFPQCGSLEAPPGVSSQMTSEGSSRASTPCSSVNTTASVASAIENLALEEPVSSSQTDDTGPSFAQMLREGKTMRASGEAWPTVGNKNKTVTWGGGSRQTERTSSSTAESDTELGAYSPPAKPSFNIADALKLAPNCGSSEDNTSGKKKKKKQKVLFSTGMAYAGK